MERGLPRGVSVEAAEGVDSFEGVLSAMRDLHADRGEFGSLVIDTADALEGHLLEYVCGKHDWPNIEKPAYGKGWVAADFLQAVTP